MRSIIEALFETFCVFSASAIVLFSIVGICMFLAKVLI